MEAIKLSNFASKVSIIEHRNTLLISTVQPVIGLSAAFGKKNGLSSLAVWKVDIVEDTVLSDFLISNYLQTYQRCIPVANFLFQRPKNLDIIEDIEGYETRFGTLGTSHLNDGALFASCTEQESPLIRNTNKFVRNLIKHNLSYDPSFYKSGGGLICNINSLYLESDTTCRPLCPAFLRTASFASETTSATMEEIFFKSISLNLYGPLDMMAKRRGHRECWQ